MRSIMRKSVVLAGACLLVAGATTNAAASSVLEVKVPFSFVVHGRSFPAGQYMVERNDMSSVLLIRGEKGNHNFTFVPIVPAGGQDPAGAVPALSFKLDDEKQYRLSSVWDSSGEGWSLTGR